MASREFIGKPIIQEMIQVMKKDYGREVSAQEAGEIIAGLADYFDSLLKLFIKGHFNNYDNGKSPNSRTYLK